MSEEQTKPENRARPTTDEFRTFVAQGWAPRSAELPELTEAARRADVRRDELSAAFPGERLVVPAGGRLVAVVGLDDVVVVDTGDALLVTTRARAQDVKAIVEDLQGSAPELT